MDLRGLILGLRGLNFGPEGADFRPERADFGPERGLGGDGRTSENSPLCPTGPLGPLPKKFSIRGHALGDEENSV